MVGWERGWEGGKGVIVHLFGSVLPELGKSKIDSSLTSFLERHSYSPSQILQVHCSLLIQG